MTRKNVNKIIIGLIVLVIIIIIVVLTLLAAKYLPLPISTKFISSDARSSKTNKAVIINEVKIGEALNSPLDYQGKTISIKGKLSNGQKIEYCDYSKIAKKTKKDRLIYDETGCIYISGDIQNINDNPALGQANNQTVAQNIITQGVIRVINNKPILVQLTVAERLMNLPVYYQKLGQQCTNPATIDCCISSLESMASGNYQAAPDGKCLDQFNTTGLSCPDSFNWCTPVNINTQQKNDFYP